MLLVHRLRHYRRRRRLFFLVTAIVLAVVALFLYFNTGSIVPTPPLVQLTLLHSAKHKGAVCLDGSPPAYHLHRGWGSGARNWLLHLEGGSWCHSVDSCTSRKFTRLGSSHYMANDVPFVGILSNNPSENPDFYNWNRVKILYCDGASFAGDVESERQNGEQLFLRGQRIWVAIIEELKLQGLASAKQALLTGCSAGGLATYIHCDDFRAALPEVGRVKCLADAGFFLDEKDISGKQFIRSFYNDVVHLHDVGKRFPDCISRMDPAQCFFPHEIIKNIKTPIFVLNPAYDNWQMEHILAPEASDPQQSWLKCKVNIHNCNSTQLESLQGLRSALLNALSEFQQNKNGGMFINSCFVHCQTMESITWHSSNSPRINNKTIAEAVGDWYFERSQVKYVDDPYPSNPTCYNLDLEEPFKLQ